MVTKQNLRIQAQKIRAHLDIELISAKILSKILALKAYQEAKNIMLFYPKKNEVDLAGLFNDTSKNFFLPKVNDSELLICPYKLGDELILSKLQVMEPASNPSAASIDLIIVPALMVDKKNYRLGYGGGFYDRFLKTQTQALKITPIPSALIIENLPQNDFDQKIDLIISEL